MERNIPIIIFNMRTPGHIAQVVSGVKHGTLVSNGTSSGPVVFDVTQSMDVEDMELDGALLSRIAFAACSCASVRARRMMTTWRDYLLNKSQTHTWMVYIPGLPQDLDYPEILGLNVPNAALVLNNHEDQLFTVPEMERADRILAEVYKKAGAAEAAKAYIAKMLDGAVFPVLITVDGREVLPGPTADNSARKAAPSLHRHCLRAGRRQAGDRIDICELPALSLDVLRSNILNFLPKNRSHKNEDDVSCFLGHGLMPVIRIAKIFQATRRIENPLAHSASPLKYM
jgi:hypothetical protein